MVWYLRNHQILPTNETITADIYKRCMKKITNTVPVLVNRKGSILLHYNPRSHTSWMTVTKLNELNFEILQHPWYSPDLSPTDCHFKHLDYFLAGKTFSNAINDFIYSKNSDFVKNGMYSLVDGWQKCIDAAGPYFDK